MNKTATTPEEQQPLDRHTREDYTMPDNNLQKCWRSRPQQGYTDATAPNWAARFGSRLSRRRTSATISTGGFFSSVESMAECCRQSRDWPVSFCTGTANLQPTRLPIPCLAADEAVIPKQLENRNHATR